MVLLLSNRFIVVSWWLVSFEPARMFPFFLGGSQGPSFYLTYFYRPRKLTWNLTEHDGFRTNKSWKILVSLFWYPPAVHFFLWGVFFPSFFGKKIVLTIPVVWNFGSSRSHSPPVEMAKGLVVWVLSNVPALTARKACKALLFENLYTWIIQTKTKWWTKREAIFF